MKLVEEFESFHYCFLCLVHFGVCIFARGLCVRERLWALGANIELVFVLAKAGTDPNSAAWAAYYAHYYQQQAQPPPAAPAGAPTTTQTNGQGNYGNKTIYFLLINVKTCIWN